APRSRPGLYADPPDHAHHGLHLHLPDASAPHHPAAHPAAPPDHADDEGDSDEHLPGPAADAADIPDHASHQPVNAALQLPSVILVLVPLAGVVLGIGLYLALRAAGVLNILGADAGSRESRSWPTTWSERAAQRRHQGPVS